MVQGLLPEALRLHGATGFSWSFSLVDGHSYSTATITPTEVVVIVVVAAAAGVT